MIAFFAIIFSFFPLLVFDLRHNFANTKPILEFLEAGRNPAGFETQRFFANGILFPKAFSRLIYTFGDGEVAKQYSYCQNYVAERLNATPLIFLASVIFVIVGFLFWSFRTVGRKNPLFLILALIGLYFLGIQFYGTFFKADIFEHYITGVFAPFMLIFAYLVGKTPKKLWIFIISIFIFVNLIKLADARNSMGLAYKKEAIAYTMQQVGEKQFSLDSLSTCWKYSGYRYLFAVFGREPVKSYVDPNLGHLYGETPIAQKHPQTVVTFVTHDFAPESEEFYRRYAKLKSYEVKNAIFGNIEVTISDNSSGWFEK